MSNNYNIEYMNLGKEFEYELSEFHTIDGYNINILIDVVNKVINHYINGYVVVDIEKHPSRNRYIEVLQYSLLDIIKSGLDTKDGLSIIGIRSYDNLIGCISGYTIDINNNFTTYESKMLEEIRNDKIDNLLK